MTTTVKNKIKFYDIVKDKNLIIKEIESSKLKYNKKGWISVEESYKKSCDFINNL